MPPALSLAHLLLLLGGLWTWVVEAVPGAAGGPCNHHLTMLRPTGTLPAGEDEISAGVSLAPMPLGSSWPFLLPAGAIVLLQESKYKTC